MREMKDSGVEWIGEIPEDWNVGKTLYALSMPITDGPHETPELFDEGIPFISAEAVFPVKPLKKTSNKIIAGTRINVKRNCNNFLIIVTP